MKTLILFAVACAAPAIFAESLDSDTAFKMTGSYISVGLNTSEGSSSSENHSEFDAAWTAVVVVSHEITDDSGDSKSIELVSSNFLDGKVVLTGHIDTPTQGKVSLETADGRRLEANVMISPGDYDTSFKVLDYPGSFYDRLILVGSALLGKDQTERFAVVGDLSDLEDDLDLTIASVSKTVINLQGFDQRVELGTVLLEENKFAIETDIREPTVVNIDLLPAGPEITSGKLAFWAQLQAVVEPGSTISVTPYGSSRELIATAGRGKHAILVESWLLDDEYLATLNAYAMQRNKYQEEMVARQAAPQLTEADSNELSESGRTGQEDAVHSGETLDLEIGEVETTESVDSHNDTEVERENETQKTESSTVFPRAAGCEHTSTIVAPPPQKYTPDWTFLPYYDIWQDVENVRKESLEEIAMSSDDPMDSLLALELGAFEMGGTNEYSAIPIYDKISKTLSDDIVDRRVTPRHNRLARKFQIEETNKRLSPGRRAPDFSLPDLDGEDISLYRLLEKNEIVLIDFWASWCGPCIAEFPALGDLYSDFRVNGFEIVSVSIDYTFDEWVEGTNEHQLPWINLADIGGFGEETPVSYGVGSIPHKYLVDANGCIVGKYFNSEQLEDYLIERFGS